MIEVENKILDFSGLVKKTDYNAKMLTLLPATTEPSEILEMEIKEEWIRL